MGLNDPETERNIFIIIKKYLKRDAFFDVMGSFPILLYSLNVPNPSNEEELMAVNADIIYKVCWVCKLFRLFHVYEVNETQRRLLDQLSTIFYL